MATPERRKIGIIGAGKLGSSLAASLYAKSYTLAISSRRQTHQQWLQDRFPNATILDDHRRITKTADTVFITTSDAAIKEVCDSIDWQPHHWVIHCSGALTLEVLNSAKNLGAGVAGFHPLQTFPFDAADWLLNKIAFAVDCPADCNNNDLRDWLEELAKEHGSQTFAINGEAAHAAYHASAVLACGLLAGLVGISAELWQHAGIDRERALQMMSPMLKSTVDAIANNGLPDAISGPYVRGDVETIRKHLDITSDVNPETSQAYAALALAQLHIANEKGKLDDSTLNGIRKLLNDHLATQ